MAASEAFGVLALLLESPKGLYYSLLYRHSFHSQWDKYALVCSIQVELYKW